MSTAQAEFVQALPALRPRVYRYCVRMIGSVVDAEDLAQDTLTQAHRSIGGLRDPARLEAWVLRIARNKSLDWLRGRTPHWQPLEQTPEAQTPALDPSERLDMTPALTTLLLSLPPRERSALLLKDVMDLPLSEIAEICDSSVGAIKAALHRGRRKLASGVPVPPKRPLPPSTRAWVDRYLDRFNAQDWPAVLEFTRQDAALEVVGAGQGQGHAFMTKGYFVNYGRIPRWRFTRAWVGVQEAVVQWRPDDAGGWAPHSVLALHVTHNQLTAARDFVHVEHLLRGLEVRAIEASATEPS